MLSNRPSDLRQAAEMIRKYKLRKPYLRSIAELIPNKMQHTPEFKDLQSALAD